MSFLIFRVALGLLANGLIVYPMNKKLFMEERIDGLPYTVGFIDGVGSLILSVVFGIPSLLIVLFS